MTELTCIICPNGCRVTVDDNGNVSGNKCPRGVTYAKQEATHPMRTITSTFKVNGGEERVLPCKTENPIPKELIFKIMEEINKIEVNYPVKLHQVLIENVLNTGVNVIATKGSK